MAAPEDPADGSGSAASGYVIAFDFGMRHIGVAVGQSVTATATPLTTLRARDGVPDWTALTALIREWRPRRLLVGLPLNMDGSESAMSARARRFGNRLAGRTGVTVTLVDERLTSVEAREHDPEDRHAEAAVLIAEGWLRDPWPDQ